MKNEQQLRRSYQTLLENFNQRKSRKIQNLSLRESELLGKISKLETELAELRQHKAAIENEVFQDFNSFRASAEKQSNQATAKSLSKEALPPDPEDEISIFED